LIFLIDTITQPVWTSCLGSSHPCCRRGRRYLHFPTRSKCAVQHRRPWHSTWFSPSLVSDKRTRPWVVTLMIIVTGCTLL